MNKKTIYNYLSLCILALALTACASQTPSYSPDSLTLDTAIREAASHFIQPLSANARVAIVSFDTPTGRLSDYIFEELWTRFEDTRKFVMVDRRNLERVEAEIRHQYGAGRVDDRAMVSVSRQVGAQILVYGQMTSLGRGASAPEYRLTVYAIDVEKATSSQRAFNVRHDNRLASLLNAPAEEEVERAVALMARNVDKKTIIAVGRISFGDTQTVSNFSAWLKNGIVAGAHKQQDKFQVATDNESSDFAVASRGMTVETPIAGSNTGSAISAVVIGSYTQLDTGAEVTLQLVSTGGNKLVMSSSRFFVSASELQRRRLSLLPENNNKTITRAEFETRQQAAAPYSGNNNRWNFTVTPDVLDGIYYDGDYMTMRIYSARDCYFRVIHVDVNGYTQVIYPVSSRDNNFIRAGETRRIPDNTRFRMHDPYGEEMILVSAYDQPFVQGQISGSFSADSIARGLTVVDNNRASISPSATARLFYTILPRR